MIWVGVGLFLAPAVGATLFLSGLHLFLQRNYVPYMVRIFQEVPLFVIPRGQPRPDAEDVRFPTSDDLTLCGCYLKTPKQRRGVVLFGLEFGSNRWSCTAYCDHLLEAGYDVFAYEPRNQGDSDREPKFDPLHWVCDRDKLDAAAALAYLKSRPDADPRGVGLYGISKGAGAGLLAAVEDPYIRCAVTDGMFASVSTVVAYMRKWILIYNKSYFVQGLLPSWYYASLAMVGIPRVGAARHVRFVHLEGAVRRFGRPLLMIHGQNDRYIPSVIAQWLFGMARQPKELWLIPGANHNQGLNVAGDEYRKRVCDFFDRYLAAAS